MITFLFVGRTDKEFLPFLEDYRKRIEKFSKIKIIELNEIKDISKLSILERKKKESQYILNNLKDNDYLILLDEKGDMFTSSEFSGFIEKKQHVSFNLVFLVGGPYGFDDIMYKRANFIISLSKMTLTHQMIRLFILEQVYRSYNIINNTSYHH